jgi:hypothetical protein
MVKDAEAAAAKKSATSEQPDSLRRLHAAQKIAAAPYVVLNGSVRFFYNLPWIFISHTYRLSQTFADFRTIPHGAVRCGT